MSIGSFSYIFCPSGVIKNYNPKCKHDRPVMYSTPEGASFVESITHPYFRAPKVLYLTNYVKTSLCFHLKGIVWTDLFYIVQVVPLWGTKFGSGCATKLAPLWGDKILLQMSIGSIRYIFHPTEVIKYSSKCKHQTNRPCIPSQRGASFVESITHPCFRAPEVLNLTNYVKTSLCFHLKGIVWTDLFYIVQVVPLWGTKFGSGCATKLAPLWGDKILLQMSIGSIRYIFHPTEVIKYSSKCKHQTNRPCIPSQRGASFVESITHPCFRAPEVLNLTNYIGFNERDI